ncbi:MAG: hypothetical protein L0H73_08880 [Nitrococcus sp.]|nr:hypothetical protein [Nitrococcus sp.]
MKATSEAAFETAIEAVLLANGYARVEAQGFDRERAVFPAEALAFIRATRPKVWENWKRCTAARPRNTFRCRA